MDEVTQRPQTRTPRPMKIVLGLSLALNLAIAGLVLGAVVLHKTPNDGDRLGPSERINALRSLGPLAGTLSRDERRSLMDQMGGRAAMTEARRGIAAGHREVEAALRSDPFLPEAMIAALSIQRGYLAELQNSGHRALVDLIADMPPERRIELADDLAKRSRR